MFHFRPYQREDLARSALHDGVVFSWEQGLGKTLAAFAWPLLKGARHVLIVAPGSLHDQICREGLDKFGLTVRRLPDIATALNDPDLHPQILNPTTPPHHSSLPTHHSSLQDPTTPPLHHSTPHPDPLFYITSYTELGMNGADERLPEIRGSGVNATLFLSDNARRLRLATRPDLDPLSGEWEGVGEERHGIRCVHRPSLSTVIQSAFDCVVCDEAVRMKGDDTYLGEGVRRLTPAYRLVLTGTPVKNRLPDVFWLAHWAAGGHEAPTARWPYGNSPADKAAFAAEHLMDERNLTKETEAANAGRRLPGKKQTAEICQLHRLWKLFAPIVLRRRKADVGGDLVPKTLIPMRVPLATRQAETYRWHLANPPAHTTDGREMNRLAAVAAQLGNLRQAALAPDTPGIDRGGCSFTPKTITALQIVRECLERHESVVLFSPFQHWSRTVTGMLARAGVSVVCLDGSVSPAKRGRLAAQFKAGKYPVLVAGIKSMGEGHSFDHCPNLILPSLDWAYDANAQAIERVHRLTSRQAVRIYTLIARGTIDERLSSLFSEKTDAADLALDGQLFKPETQEVNLFELLQRALTEFDPQADTIPEDQLAHDWATTLLPALRHAAANWSGVTAPSHHSDTPPLQPLPTAPPDDFRALPWRDPRNGELVYETFLKVPGGIKHLVIRDWGKEHLEHLNEPLRLIEVRHLTKDNDYVSKRPYQLGQAGDGSIAECVHALYRHWCRATNHDAAALYDTAYPDHQDYPAEDTESQQLADWQGVAYPDTWDEAAFNGLLESLHAINHHSLANHLEDLETPRWITATTTTSPLPTQHSPLSTHHSNTPPLQPPLLPPSAFPVPTSASLLPLPSSPTLRPFRPVIDRTDSGDDATLPPSAFRLPTFHVPLPLSPTRRPRPLAPAAPRFDPEPEPEPIPAGKIIPFPVPPNPRPATQSAFLFPTLDGTLAPLN